VLLFSFVYVIVNLAVDLLYTVLDRGSLLTVVPTITAAVPQRRRRICRIYLHQ